MKRKVTNRLGLALPFVRAVENDSYDPHDGGQKSDYTISSLLEAPRTLRIMRTAEIVEDAGDLLFSLQGQLIHDMLERAGEDLTKEGWIIEKRFYKKYVVDEKEFVISSKIDAFDSQAGELSDYKYTSVGAAKRGLKEGHHWQVNFQARLLREHGYVVKTGNATILMRDWSAERDYAGYPECPTMKHVVQLISDAEVDAWVVERIRAHEASALVLPSCTDEERWSRPTFAVMKTPTAARATRVLDTRAEAEAFVAAKAQGQQIVERPGEDVRCLRYCPVRSVCSYRLEKHGAPTVANIELTSKELDDGLVKL